MALEDASIAVEGLVVRRDGRTILNLSAWDVPSGAQGLVAGPSGSGKTKLVNVLAGLTLPDAGAVTAAGVDWARLSPAQRDRARARAIGIVFQNVRLINALSVAGNMRLAARLAGRQVDRAQITGLLDRLGVVDKAEAKPRTLSLGEAQRAAVARAVIGRPRLVLADEPTSALDDFAAARVADLLASEAKKADATLLIITHDARLKKKFPVLLELEKGAA